MIIFGQQFLLEESLHAIKTSVSKEVFRQWLNFCKTLKNKFKVVSI